MIYFVRAENTDYVKIGYYQGILDRRVSNLQIGCPLKLIVIRAIEGTHSQEQELHKLFSPYHVRGEWFLFTQEMLDINLDRIPEEKINVENIFKERIEGLIKEGIFPTIESIRERYPGYKENYIIRNRKVIKDLTLHYYGCTSKKVYDILNEIQELSKTMKPSAIRRKLGKAHPSLYVLKRHQGALLRLPSDFFKPHVSPNHTCRNPYGARKKSNTEDL